NVGAGSRLYRDGRQEGTGERGTVLQGQRHLAARAGAERGVDRARGGAVELGVPGRPVLGRRGSLSLQQLIGAGEGRRIGLGLQGALLRIPEGSLGGESAKSH